MLCAARASAQGRPADPPTVALFAYHKSPTGATLLPVRQFNGVLITGRTILTATAALQGKAGRIAAPSASPDALFALVRVNGRDETVTCRPASNNNPDSPLATLELDEIDAARIARLFSAAPTIGPLSPQSPAYVVGVLSPYGLDANELADTVPPAVRLSVHFAAATRQIGSPPAAVADVVDTLPDQMLGAAVWNDQSQWVGVVARHDNRWVVVSVEPLKSTLNPPSPAPSPESSPQPAPDPTPSPQATPDTPAPTTPTPAPTTLSDQRMIDLMAEMKLTLKIHPQLVDTVGQEQADMVMAYIAGGASDKAIALLNEIESLATEELAEQLNYRHALALVLSGQSQAALPRAQKTQSARNALVKARGRALLKVIDGNEAGTYLGRPLSDSFVLAEAMRASLADVADQFQRSFQYVRQQRVVNPESYQRVNEKLDSLTNLVKLQQYSWPGYFDDLIQQIELYRGKITRDEHARARQRLTEIRAELDKEKAQIEYKSGAGWYKPGYYPRLRVGRANVLIDEYNQTLRHYQAIDEQLDPAERVALPEDAAKPIERMAVAVKSER